LLLVDLLLSLLLLVDLLWLLLVNQLWLLLLWLFILLHIVVVLTIEGNNSACLQVVIG